MFPVPPRSVAAATELGALKRRDPEMRRTHPLPSRGAAALSSPGREAGVTIVSLLEPRSGGILQRSHDARNA